MKIKTFSLPVVLFLALVSIFGCAKFTSMTTQKMFDDPMSDYRRAILWSDFETASASLVPELRSDEIISNEYKDIKVTSYDTKRIIVDKDTTHIQQIVEIRYYRKNRMVEKNITDNQEWAWYPESKKWYLTSGLPNFE